MRTAVVIGSAPSPAGRSWGERIDAADLVVRMWDWHWQGAADYGSRCDAAVFTTTPSYLDAVIDRSAPMCWPATWWAYDIHGHWHGRSAWPTLAGRPIEVMDVRAWADAAMDAGYAGTARLARKFDLTRGAAAAIWAVLSRRPDVLVLVGMDGIVDGRWAPACERYAAGAFEAFLAPGQEAKPVPDDGMRTPSHHAEGERWAVMQAAASAGVKVVSAAEAWA